MKDEKNQGKSKDSLTPFFRALALSLSLFLLLPLPLALSISGSKKNRGLNPLCLVEFRQGLLCYDRYESVVFIKEPASMKPVWKENTGALVDFFHTSGSDDIVCMLYP